MRKSYISFLYQILLRMLDLLSRFWYPQTFLHIMVIFICLIWPFVKKDGRIIVLQMVNASRFLHID